MIYDVLYLVCNNSLQGFTTERVILRGTIVNGTYGIHKNLPVYI